MAVSWPFGRGKLIGQRDVPLKDEIFGGWRLSNIFDWQTGDHLTLLPRGSACELGDPQIGETHRSPHVTIFPLLRNFS
jgi:hypothetical protein